VIRLSLNYGFTEAITLHMLLETLSYKNTWVGEQNIFLERKQASVGYHHRSPIHYLILVKYSRRFIYSLCGRINPRTVINGLPLGRQLKTKLGRIHIGNVPQKRFSVADILRGIL